MNDDTSAKLMKWPSLGGQRISTKDGASPYTIKRGSLRDCVDALRGKPESSHHLYEIHTGDSTVISAAEAMTLMPKREEYPPPEESYGDQHMTPAEYGARHQIRGRQGSGSM